MILQYAPQSRAERLIATGRVVLAVFSLATIWLDPSTPPRHAHLFYALLALYALYAGLLAVVEWSRDAPLVRLRLLIHAFDLAVFSLFMFLGEGPTSPFFVYFVFSLLCGTLRWQRRGTFGTAAAALLAFIGTGVYGGEVLHDPAFVLNRFVIRGVYLAVAAILLAYMGEHEERVRGEMGRLAAWSGAVPREVETLAREVLDHAAAVLEAPRALLAWDDPEEPWRHLAWWSPREFHTTREPPGAFEPLVPQALRGAGFLCPDARAAVPAVLHTSGSGLRRWHGGPVHPDLAQRFGVQAVIGLALRGEAVEGRLFVLDKPGMTSDDLVLGEIVARQGAARMDHFYLSQRLLQAAATEERIRLARDLHDGVLQSLAGTALQLEAVHGLVAEAPGVARERLREVQRLIAVEQHDLRAFIRQLRPAPLGGREASEGLASRLEELRARIERQWGLRVELQTAVPGGRLSDELAHQVYRIVHEALVNAARHAGASTVRVEVGLAEDRVRIRVADDGHGFPFRGRHELATLIEQNLGPVTLRERVASLRGALVVESTAAGARLDVSLPLARGAA